MSAATYVPYLQFELQRIKRNPRAILFTSLIPLMMYILFSATSDGNPLNNHREILASMVAYGAIGGALLSCGPPLAQERAIGWLRQLSATPLPASAAVIAKIGVAMVLAGAGSLLVGGIGAVTGSHLGIVTLLELVVAMVLCSVCFAMLGLIFGAGVKAPEAAQGATVLAYLTLSAIGGLWVPPDQFPDWLHHIATFLPTYHVREIGYAIVDGNAIPLNSVLVLAIWTAVLARIARKVWQRGARTGR
jgi:ABC-2 type transport system permease protein